MSDFKVDAVLYPTIDSIYHGKLDKVRLRARNTFAGTTKWWVEVYKDGHADRMDALSEYCLNFFEERKSFFRMGHKYQFPSGEYTYEVMDIYSVEKPMTSDRLFAIAMKTDRQGNQSITSLRQVDFSRMTEVE